MAQKSEDVWREFCRKLADSANILASEGAPQSELTQAEGLRYLTRLTRAALESMIESSDVSFPRLHQMTSDTVKIGGDNPDTLYWNASISGAHAYRITGRRGDVPYLSFGTKANRLAVDGRMASTGELEDAAMMFADDGSFEIVVSRAPQGPNWLPMSEDSSTLIVRQTFLNRDRERPAMLSIERIGEPARPGPLSLDAITSKLEGVAAFVAGTGRTFAQWSRMFMDRPNELLPRDQSIFQNVGGDPNIHYLHGYWRLEPGQAWVIETKVPTCRFWNFVLQNWWMESNDYRHIPNAWLNPTKAKLEPDGRLIIVVSDQDPGYGNWIDTAGHSEGTALLRWVSAASHPVPSCRIEFVDAPRRASL